MGTLLLLATAVGLFVYAVLIRLRSFSPRKAIVRQLGYRPANRAAVNAEKGLGQWLRQVPLTRRVTIGQFGLLMGGLAAGTALLLLLPWLLFGWSPNPTQLLGYPLLVALLPAVWLYLQSRRRRASLSRTYPDLLAHLLTQTRAGAGTLQAFASSPSVLREPLRGEIEDLIADMAVAPFPAALERFASRCDIPEIRAFASNVTYQQSLGIALCEVLASEESHSIAMARQQLRQRIQASSIIMASVTVLLLLNGLFIYFTPVVYDLSRLISQQP